jgi:hypothetical protein
MTFKGIPMLTDFTILPDSDLPNHIMLGRDWMERNGVRIYKRGAEYFLHMDRFDQRTVSASARITEVLPTVIEEVTYGPENFWKQQLDKEMTTYLPATTVVKKYWRLPNIQELEVFDFNAEENESSILDMDSDTFSEREYRSEAEFNKRLSQKAICERPFEDNIPVREW